MIDILIYVYFSISLIIFIALIIHNLSTGFKKQNEVNISNGCKIFRFISIIFYCIIWIILLYSTINRLKKGK